jgi:hypothetical protein
VKAWWPAVASALVLGTSASGAANPTRLPALPHGWPGTLQLGLTDNLRGAAALRRSAPVGFRYTFLSLGANTGKGWSTWTPNGSFVSGYIRESISAGFRPFFSYYMLRHSLPGHDDHDETRGDLTNLANPETMQALLADLELFYRRAGAFRQTVVLQLEPDLWGLCEKVASGEDARTIPAAVVGSLAGYAREAVRLRDRLAPNVLLAYPISIWGTHDDIAISDPSDRQLDVDAARAARFYRSLGARFDLATTEFNDRDSAFERKVSGEGPEAWWNAGDFRRHARFLGGFSRLTGLRIVLWQIPLGNTVMRAQNDTWGHFQDNRVQWLLGPGSRAHLRTYLRAGVIAALFGGGGDGTSCACDAQHDGVTNPEPINGNTRLSVSADDDGGYFRERARMYYRAGVMLLPSR